MPFGAQSRLLAPGWVLVVLMKAWVAGKGKRTKLEAPSVVCRHFALHNYIV